MKISIITVSFNSAKTIRDTIESVLSQTYPDIEYIVVDGNSKDDTVNIIREYEPRFNGRMRWVSEPDKGLYAAMNKGIRLATGDVVGIINSDDFFTDKEVIEKIANAFIRENVDTLYANLYFVKPEDTSCVVRILKGKKYVSGLMRRGWAPAHPTFYVKRSVYEKFGVFDTSFSVSADFELMLRFIEKYHASTYFLDEFIVKMRMGGESTGSVLKILEGNKNIVRAFKKNDIPVSIFYPLMRLTPKVIDLVLRKIGIR